LAIDQGDSYLSRGAALGLLRARARAVMEESASRGMKWCVLLRNVEQKNTR
jgi:hypothetical protein